MKIEYVVESLLTPPNAFPLQSQLSIQCADPYFYAPYDTDVTVLGLQSLFKLPFHFPSGQFKISQLAESEFCNISNIGEAETGMTISFSAVAEVVNPSLLNVLTGQIAKLNYTMAAGDTITITTQKGNKTIKLLSGDVETDFTNYKVYPFTFLQLPSGTTTFKCDADSGRQSLRCKVKFKLRFTNCYTEDNV